MKQSSPMAWNKGLTSLIYCNELMTQNYVILISKASPWFITSFIGLDYTFLWNHVDGIECQYLLDHYKQTELVLHEFMAKYCILVSQTACLAIYAVIWMIQELVTYSYSKAVGCMSFSWELATSNYQFMLSKYLQLERCDIKNLQQTPYHWSPVRK